MPGKDKELMQALHKNSGFETLSDEQEEWFYWTNLSRQKPKFFFDSVIQPILKLYPKLESNYTKSLKIDLYALQHLALVIPNSKLLTLAQGHADDLAKQKKLLLITQVMAKAFKIA